MTSRKVPLISMGMPLYNEARWLRQAMDALCAQTFSDWELIISDNASTDHTWDILQEYAARDTRITLHRQPENIGAIENFEFVLGQARGDYFMWVSGHDLWSENLLEVLLKEMQANPRLVLGVPQSVLIDEENQPITVFDEFIDTRLECSAAGRISAMHRQITRCNAIYGLHRLPVLLKALPWPRIMGGDFVLLVRIAALGDVLTNPTAQWFRRRNRPQQTNFEIVRHRVQSLKLSKLAAAIPNLVTRIVIIMVFLKANGSYRDRIKLMTYGLKKLFLERGQPQLLTSEFIRGGAILIQLRNSKK